MLQTIRSAAKDKDLCTASLDITTGPGVQHSARCGELGKVMIGRNVGCASARPASAGARNHTARFVTLNPHVDYPAPPTTSCGIPPAALGRTANPSTTTGVDKVLSGEGLGAVSGCCSNGVRHASVVPHSGGVEPLTTTPTGNKHREKQESHLTVVSRARCLVGGESGWRKASVSDDYQAP